MGLGVTWCSRRCPWQGVWTPSSPKQSVILWHISIVKKSFSSLLRKGNYLRIATVSASEELAQGQMTSGLKPLDWNTFRNASQEDIDPRKKHHIIRNIFLRVGKLELQEFKVCANSQVSYMNTVAFMYKLHIFSNCLKGIPVYCKRVEFGTRTPSD